MAEGTRLHFDDGSPPLEDAGVYADPQGNTWLISVRNVVLICGDSDHEHDMSCYEDAPKAGTDGD